VRKWLFVKKWWGGGRERGRERESQRLETVT